MKGESDSPRSTSPLLEHDDAEGVEGEPEQVEPEPLRPPLTDHSFGFDDATLKRSVPLLNAALESENTTAFTIEFHPRKGRIVRSRREFRPMEQVVTERPLAIVGEAEGNVEYVRLVEACAQVDGSLEPSWYWAAVNSLSPEEFVSTEEGHAGVKALRSCLQRLSAEEYDLISVLDHPVMVGLSDVTMAVLTLAGWIDVVRPLHFERMLKIWTTNAFLYSHEPTALALYFIPSFFSHSCYPNCEWELGPDGLVRLRAKMHIDEDDELSFNYLDDAMLVRPVGVRREVLRRRRGFQCMCDRCMHEEYTGEMLQGLCCPSCGRAIFFYMPPKGWLRKLRLAVTVILVIFGHLIYCAVVSAGY
ncbi:unnamed protein product [Vitrella brassicaformis CCMP3155]|uniref:SET domain-containing protein n=1 Tax=Vitrella brassicaformis (strain CCMP3155) TaxID=1169540 RepID=A0A0G4G701_VITBC|nr:unnamed protein product [Vitrella brassicaformis CCMP3155]|eukprot:CEM23993.1 unnamed protein product [Vitrella brassicaformis CCMP3155]